MAEEQTIENEFIEFNYADFAEDFDWPGFLQKLGVPKYAIDDTDWVRLELTDNQRICWGKIKDEDLARGLF